MSRGSRQPTSWLVLDYPHEQPTLLGGPQVVFGRASYDRESDTLTVTTLPPARRLHVTTQGGHGDLQALAKHLLRELIRTASARS